MTCKGQETCGAVRHAERPALSLALSRAGGRGLGLATALRGNVSTPGIFCDLCPTGGLLPLICWATLYGFAPWPPGRVYLGGFSMRG